VKAAVASGRWRWDLSDPVRSPALRRGPFLLLGFACLLLGVGAGLARLGTGPGPAAGAPLHGALMLPGFLGTLIGVERAAAARRAWAWAAPLLTGAGALAALASGGAASARAAVAAGAIVLVLALAVGFPSLRAPAAATQAVAALCFAVGSARWAAGAAIWQAAPWWVAFPVLTIAGERLELSRVVAPPARWQRAFGAIVALVVLGLVVGEAARDVGLRLQGLGYAALAAWLARFDLARRSLRRPGRTRFMAVAVLSGLVWLAIGGLGALFHGLPPAGRVTDGLLHAWLLGFVFPLVFAHAPLILPAVLGVAIAYRPRFHVHLWLLHAGLVLRIAADLAGSLPLRRGGAWLNAAAVVLFLVQTAGAVRRPAPPTSR
jgi:hypothetical protein